MLAENVDDELLAVGGGDGDDLDVALPRCADQVPEHVVPVFHGGFGTVDDKRALRCAEFGEQDGQTVAEGRFERQSDVRELAQVYDHRLGMMRLRVIVGEGQHGERALSDVGFAADHHGLCTRHGVAQTRRGDGPIQAHGAAVGPRNLSAHPIAGLGVDAVERTPASVAALRGVQQIVDIAPQIVEYDFGRRGRVVVGQCNKPVAKAEGRRRIGIRHDGHQRVRDPRPVGVVGRLEPRHVHDQVGQESPCALFDHVSRGDALTEILKSVLDERTQVVESGSNTCVELAGCGDKTEETRRIRLLGGDFGQLG